PIAPRNYRGGLGSPTPHARREAELATRLAHELLPSLPEGGPYDPRSNLFPTFDDERLYLVSLPGHERRLCEAPTARNLIDWLIPAQRVCAAHRAYLGWWRDGDAMVLDVSVPIVGDRDEVLKLAGSWGQQAVYQPTTQQVIYVASPVERAA